MYLEYYDPTCVRLNHLKKSVGTVLNQDFMICVYVSPPSFISKVLAMLLNQKTAVVSWYLYVCYYKEWRSLCVHTGAHDIAHWYVVLCALGACILFCAIYDLVQSRDCIAHLGISQAVVGCFPQRNCLPSKLSSSEGTCILSHRRESLGKWVVAPQIECLQLLLKQLEFTCTYK